MNMDDSRVRQMILAVRPDIKPRCFEVSETDYGAAMHCWFRQESGEIITGRAIAVNCTEKEVAEELLSQIMAEEARRMIAAQDIGDPLYLLINEDGEVVSRSPYEGKRGKHPADCRCSTHLKARSGATQ